MADQQKKLLSCLHMCPNRLLVAFLCVHEDLALQITVHLGDLYLSGMLCESPQRNVNLGKECCT